MSGVKSGGCTGQDKMEERNTKQFQMVRNAREEEEDV